MVDLYGADEYGADVYGGTLSPIITTDFIEYFPHIIPRELTSVIRKYIDSHGQEYDGYDAASRYVRRSRQVDIATETDLDKIGALFGALGRRGTRTEDEYRAYLQSLVDSFNGRGSVIGLKFAIAAAVNTDTSNVVINEDFENNEYEIQLKNVEADFLSGAVNELAQLADPSAVELSAPPVIVTTGDQLFVDRTTSSVIDTTDGLGSNTLTLDGNSQLQ